MSNIQIFENEKFGKVRVIDRNGEPWFVAADVCKVLAMTSITYGLKKLDPEDHKFILIKTNGGDQKVRMLSKNALMSIVKSCKKAERRDAVTSWIRDVVFPALGVINRDEEDPAQNIPGLQIFSSSEFGKVRVINDNGTPLFCGTDVAVVLGYTNPQKAINDHCKGVKKALTKRYANGDPFGQEMNFIPESDVYRLIFSSKLPSAERFERWVVEEVLPTIRKTGGYIAGEEKMSDDELIFKAMTVLQAKLDARSKELAAANEKIGVLEPKADYYDSLVEKNHLTGVRDAAKELHVKQNWFSNWLIGKGYAYRNVKGELRPYQVKSMDDGLMELKQYLNFNNGYSGCRMMITAKGMDRFRREIAKEDYIEVDAG